MFKHLWALTLTHVRHYGNCILSLLNYRGREYERPLYSRVYNEIVSTFVFLIIVELGATVDILEDRIDIKTR